MPYKKNDAELAFNQHYSRFKIIIYFRHRMPITHYGQERFHCTVSQIQWGYVKQVLLDREKGLQDCIDRISICERYYGQYTTALIYDRFQIADTADGNTHTGIPVIKYKAGQLIDGAEFRLHGKEKKTVLKVEVKSKSVYALVPIDEEPLIIPPADNIDFKSAVAEAIARPKARQKTLVYQSPNI